VFKSPVQFDPVFCPQGAWTETETVTTSNNSDFTVVIVTVGSASGSLKAEPKECLTGNVTISSTHVRFTSSFSLHLLSEQHAMKACSSIFTIPHA